MVDLLVENAGTILILLAVMWIVQFGFTYQQMRRFYSRLKIVRKDGLTAVGTAGGRYKGRVYSVITVDEDDTLLHAEYFSGITIFAGLKPVPEMVGLTIEDILEEDASQPVSKKVYEAFKNAALDIQEARQEGESNAVPGQGPDENGLDGLEQGKEVSV